MTKRFLLKGFEVELFTGSITGDHVGVAVDVKKDLSDFVIEPDHRNLEYITSPESNYKPLREALISPRRRLRNWLLPRDLTLLPGSTLSLGSSKQFERSDPLNSYHDFIESAYGTRVVTASIHINLGLENLPMLFAALRLVRCEAALFLALSASSPFLDGLFTGFHSQRWRQFPLTPAKVPIFLDHAEYVSWIEQQLADGVMKNERHLWTSVRPNGPSRPYDLNRLELRICDLITDPETLLAVTALLELRVLSLLNHPEQYDPLKASELSILELALLSDQNDAAAAKDSLDATLNHWKDGSPVKCRAWIESLIDEVVPLANENGLIDQLAPVRSILDGGNQAIQWIKAYSSGSSVRKIIEDGIGLMQVQETLATKAEVFFR